MKQWRIQGTAVEYGDANGWRASVQIPTFLLDEGYQGITCTKHALQIAASVVDPLGLASALHLCGCLDNDGGDYDTLDIIRD